MLANLRRKVGMIAGSHLPGSSMPPTSVAEGMAVPPTYMDSGVAQQPLTMEEIGFPWSGDRETFNPRAIPVWLQEQVCACSTQKTSFHLYGVTELDRSGFACQWL